ncbi:hypothetical protein P7C73_g898, partial [Tremellales sp. Uapishka_1]
MTTRIAVIGAGAAGLTQVKQLVDAFARDNVTTNLELVAYESPTVLKYLQEYARDNNLLSYIQFSTCVTRLYHTPARASPSRKWTIESENTQTSQKESQEFDYVSVANGHYSDSWIPEIPGLTEYTGSVMHSRYYRRPSDYQGQRVLVVGSYASGSDVARHLANLNVGKFTRSGEAIEPSGGLATPPAEQTAYTTVFQSSSTVPSGYNIGEMNPQTTWQDHIRPYPLISHMEGSRIYFQGTAEYLEDIDTIIFATGYNFALPFCKVTDLPWRDESARVMDKVISKGERTGGAEWEVGGLKGLGTKDLDELLLFLENDRSLAFLALQYQVVPFPLAEIQSRLIAFLWAGLVHLPKELDVPINSANPYWTPPTTPPTSGNSPQGVRKVLQQRQKLVFGASYEWIYEEYLMSLIRDVDGDSTEDCWREIEGWRRERRADLGLRMRTLGF